MRGRNLPEGLEKDRDATILTVLLKVAATAGCLLLVCSAPAFAQAGPKALEACREFAFSLEEDFVTQGPTPPDGNTIISGGDLLSVNCAVCARNRDLSTAFEVTADLGLDAVHVVDVESFLVVFATELDSPNTGQFAAGDLLAANGSVIPNSALLHQF